MGESEPEKGQDSVAFVFGGENPLGYVAFAVRSPNRPPLDKDISQEGKQKFPIGQLRDERQKFSVSLLAQPLN